MLDQGIHIICGTLGDGKTLRSVQVAEWFLQRGRKVATNVNLNIEYLCKPDCNEVLVTRLPDKPTITHLKDIGMGSHNMDQPGLLLLDELGMWCNSREFNDKTRLEIVKYAIHLRKRRWITVFIAQRPELIDKQVRVMGSTIHSCKSTKKIFWLKWLPRIHHVTEVTDFGMKAGSDLFRCTHLFKAFDTEQQFSSDLEPLYEKQDSPEERNTKRLNGYYQLLPPARLNPQDVASAVKSKNDLDIKTGIKLVASLFVAIAIFLFWPDREAPEAVTEEFASAEQIIADLLDNNPSLEAPNQELQTAEDPFNFTNGLRVQRYTRIGTKTSYTFIRYGQLIPQGYIESKGVLVRSKGMEAVLIFPNGEMKSVF